MRRPVKQIAYKYCVNFEKTEFPYRIVHQLTLSLRCKYCKIHSRSNFPDAINSIRRLAASDCKPMTLVSYHVIRLESWVRSRTLERANRRPFWRFLGNLNIWGIWTPKCCRPSCGVQKDTSLRHNACFETSRVKFHARVASVGESGETIKIKIKKRGLIFHVFRQALPYVTTKHKRGLTERGHSGRMLNAQLG